MLMFLIVLPATQFIASFHLNSNSTLTVSLDQFNVFNLLGKGLYGNVYAAVKNGGPDDGQWYALKTIEIANALEYDESSEKDSLKAEREILEALRGFPFATGLHYAFREGNWIFLVMNLVTGGSVQSKLDKNWPDANTRKLILAETVSIIEQLHNAQVLHMDLSFKNVLIDNDGHLVLADFGYSERRSESDDRNKFDWIRISALCTQIFPAPITDEIELSLQEMLGDMVDADLPALKNQSYFNGIDWKMVAERKSKAPYSPNVFEIDWENPLDLVALLKIGTDECTLDASLVERFSNYTFVAPEYQN